MKINFESSTACQARCTFCPRDNMTRPKGEMSDELFHKIIREGKAMGIKRYSPFLYGEPFIFPRIWQWLDYMEREGVWVALYTNAEFMDVDRLIKYKNIHYVTCSLNAATKETHAKVMRGPKYEAVKKNVDELFKKATFRVRTSFIRTDENIHEVDLFKSMYRKRAVGDFTNWTGDRSSFRKVTKRVPCYLLFHQMCILWDGKVVPCCNDYNAKQVLGDANKQSLKEIWENAAWIREKHRNLDFNIPVCKDCDYNIV